MNILLLLFAPLDGWRPVEVRGCYVKTGWARVMLAMDNLNTHDRRDCTVPLTYEGVAHCIASGDTLHAEVKKSAEFSGVGTR